ncbi:acyl carrier protein [Streptomyces asiaticus]|uniref:acyl carrier protein n=1 Tax=Streptomyces asiaticus TaxID=114695 RepID=UPI003F67F004
MVSVSNFQEAAEPDAGLAVSAPEAELQASVRALLSKILDVTDAELAEVSDAEDLLLAGIGLSSLMLVSWLTAIEKAYDVSLPLEEADAEQMRSISGVMTLLSGQLSGGESR